MALITNSVISLNSIIQLLYAKDKQCVFYGRGNEVLNITRTNLGLPRLKENKVFKPYVEHISSHALTQVSFILRTG
jgi:hypothetical protein